MACLFFPSQSPVSNERLSGSIFFFKHLHFCFFCSSYIFSASALLCFIFRATLTLTGMADFFCFILVLMMLSLCMSPPLC